MSEAPFRFTLEGRDGTARAGRFTTLHGAFRTPAFMPVGTHGAVKAMTPEQVTATGAEIVLSNTYHLTLRPGESLVAKLGGLHGFMRWDGPILTDSGGFQVFSLPHKDISDRGVRFKNEVDGSEVDLTPERSIEIQNALGADIIMAFDECTPWPADERLAATGVRRTLAWASRCLGAHARPREQALFGIVQGSTYLHLRESCAAALRGMDLPGYAVGGVSVGEGHAELCRITAHTAPLLPEDKPRYLMGVGLPEDIIAAIGFGMDMFDCVIPTRYARSASVFTRRGRIRLTNRRYRRDAFPIDTSCTCAACAAGFTRAYLHHLFNANEILSAILASIHNVHFYEQLVGAARSAILGGEFESWRAEFLAGYASASARGEDATGARGEDATSARGEDAARDPEL
jgi:queuine tRNA-ribosyltransferase